MEGSNNPFKRSTNGEKKKKIKPGEEMKEMRKSEGRFPASEETRLYLFNEKIAMMLADFASAVYVPFEKPEILRSLNKQLAWNCLNKTKTSHEKGIIFQEEIQDFWIFDTFGTTDNTQEFSWFGNPTYWGFIALKLSEFDRAMGIESLEDTIIKDYDDSRKSQLKAKWLEKNPGKDQAFELEIWNDNIISKIREIVIVFRGTKTKEDWVTRNFNFTKGLLKNTDFFKGLDPKYLNSLDIQDRESQISLGFAGLYNSCSTSIVEKIQRLLPNPKSSKYEPRVYVVGHSLGGALATLCALHINALLEIEPIVYTFASPAVGNEAFANLFNKKIANKYNNVINSRCSIRFLRSQDPVTSIGEYLPRFIGNKTNHVDTAIILDDSNEHAMTGYRDRVKIKCEENVKQKKDLEERKAKNLGMSQATSNFFPHLESGMNYALSDEPILLNGMKVIFDQPVGVYPVNLESKEEARRNGT